MATFLSKNTGHPPAPLALYEPGAPEGRPPRATGHTGMTEAHASCTARHFLPPSPVPALPKPEGNRAACPFTEYPWGTKAQGTGHRNSRVRVRCFWLKSQTVNAGRWSTPKASHGGFRGVDFPFYSEPQGPPLRPTVFTAQAPLGRVEDPPTATKEPLGYPLWSRDSRTHVPLDSLAAFPT